MEYLETLYGFFLVLLLLCTFFLWAFAISRKPLVDEGEVNFKLKNNESLILFFISGIPLFFVSFELITPMTPEILDFIVGEGSSPKPLGEMTIPLLFFISAISLFWVINGLLDRGEYLRRDVSERDSKIEELELKIESLEEEVARWRAINFYSR